MNNRYGLLIGNDLLLQRKYFIEMSRLYGVEALYQHPINSTKTYNIYGELNTQYSECEKVWVIFKEQPDVKTLRKLGWASETQEEFSIISVPYDLKNIQKGCIFNIPDVFNNEAYRPFRVEEISTKPIYPASLTCKLVPQTANNYDKSLNNTNIRNNNVLVDIEGEC